MTSARERSPGGRPPVGPVVNTRFSEETLHLIDQLADGCGMTRAEMIRELTEAGLDAVRSGRHLLPHRRT